MYRPTKSQREIIGYRGTQFFLGILAEQSLASTDMPWDAS